MFAALGLLGMREIFRLLITFAIFLSSVVSAESELIIPSGFDQTLLKILVCPENHTELRLASRQEIENLNQKIHLKKISTKSGNVLSEKVIAMLIRKDNKVAYKFEGGTPVMIIEEGIILE